MHINNPYFRGIPAVEVQTLNWNEAMGARIAAARDAKEMRQSDLAREMRRRGHHTIYPGRMFEIEQGTRKVKASEIPDFCRALGVPPWWLLGLTREEAQVLDATFEVD